MEDASCGELFSNPLHPYTSGLLRCIPRIDDERDTLDIISGQVPTPDRFPTGCRFHPRCPMATELCAKEAPPLSGGEDHRVACHLYASKRTTRPAYITMTRWAISATTPKSWVTKRAVMPLRSFSVWIKSRMTGRLPLLEASHLKTYFPVYGGMFSTLQGYVHAVDDVSLTVYQGETLGLVGESGCGVGMERVGKQLPAAGVLHYAPRVHHDDPLGNLRHHA